MQIVLSALFFILIYLGILGLLAFPIMFLWNSLLPHIFGLPVITHWQAWGLCLLARLIFGAETSALPGNRS